MRIDKLIVPTLFLAMAGCKGCSGEIELGQGPQSDARLTADVKTWECSDDGGETLYEGVYSFDIYLEYAPDGLQERALPGGCVYGLSMFPVDAGSSGEDIPGLSDDPRWTAGDDSGRLERTSPGFYEAQVLNNVHSCQSSDDLLSDGVMLEESANFTGAVTPAAGSIAWVSTDIEDTDDDGNLSFGETVDLSWETEDWDEVWIQIRQERDGEAWGTVTCNATGMDGFEVDENVWELLNGDLAVEYINLYVAFQNTEIQEMEDGQKIEVVTRGMHVLVVQD
jgi:hypothetical protein